MTSVYIIEAAPLIKIGIADDVAKRFRGLSFASPTPMALVHQREFSGRNSAGHVERALHRQFNAKRLHGEWFAIGAGEAVAALNAAIDPGLDAERTTPPLPPDDETDAALRYLSGEMPPEELSWRRRMIDLRHPIDRRG